jgi:hypothetical protein
VKGLNLSFNYHSIDMKILLKIILLIGLPVSSIAQGATIDSLKNILANSKSDSISYRACKFIYDHYEETNRDSAFHYAEKGITAGAKKQ